MSPGPDDAYAPLSGPAGWLPAVEDASAASAGRLRAPAHHAPAWVDLVHQPPAWADMMHQGMMLAAAYRSGALAGLYDGDEDMASGLLAGVVRAGSCGAVVAPHVLAIHDALALARDAAAAGVPATEAWIRQVHAVACAPQVTHPEPGDHGAHDHLLGHGDYKHHPNDVRTAAGDRLVFAPVELVASEMAALAAALGSEAFDALGAVSKAAYSLHAVTHVGPFAAGNGRAARVLASIPLLGGVGIPFDVPLPCAGAYRAALTAAGRGEPSLLVELVTQRCAGVVDEVERARSEAGTATGVASVRQWERRVLTANRLHELLAPAAEAALARHRGRSDLGWMADLAAAEVVAPPAGDEAFRFDAAPVTIDVPTGGGTAVQEVLALTAHPVAGPDDVVLLRAVGAEMDLAVRVGEVAGAAPAAFTGRLDALLDRAVTALAVRAAAAEDDD